MMPSETRRRLESQARRQAAEEQRGRVQRFEEQQAHIKACRAISWRTRFAACERLLLAAKARLEQDPKNEFCQKEVTDLQKCYADLLAEQPQP